MAASYPSSVKSYTTKTDGPSSTIFAAHVNELQDEIVALENALISAGLAHNLFPSADATRDLGTSSLKWRDLHMSRNASISGTVAIGSTLTVTGASAFTGATMLGHLIATDNTFDIGASGATRFRDLFLARNASIGGTLAVGSNLSVTGSTSLSGATNAVGGTLSVTGALTAASTYSETAIITPAQITGNQNNYNPTGFATSRVLNLSSDASRNITGLMAGATGDRRLLINSGAQNIVLTHQDVASDAANRFACPGGGSFTLNTFDAVELYYISGSGWWVLGF